VTGPIAVTPVLFMSDGTEYDLPTVNVPASGVATVNVNNALSSAAAANAGSLANHLSQYGSASLRFSGVAPTVIAQTALGSPVRSLSYVARFTGILEGQPVSQTLEGLWWTRDAGMGGFVSLSNASGGVRNVSVQAITANGQAQPAQSFTLAPHAEQMLDLVTLVGRQLNAGEAGGLRIQFTGLEGEINVVGGLESQAGYSATMPFWMPPMTSMSASGIVLGHAGVMVGAPDAMMGFPAGTRFTPYLALRNLTAQVVPTSLILYTEQGTALPGPSQTLQPFESRQVDMSNLLQGLGMKDLNGMLTLAVGHTGQANDVIAAVGSADASGTYVFEVEGRTAEQGLSKQSPYWTVKDGSDTMVAVWNPTPAPEDVIVTLKYADSSGHYRFRVHLAAYATANLDVKELIADQSPDDEGNVIPSSKQEGSFVFQSAADVHAPLSLNVNVGIFNVLKGTCYYGTIWCDGYTGVTISPSSLTLPVPGNQQMNALGQYYDGTTPGVNAYTTWSSSNSSVASINPGGQVTAAGNGSATITATAKLPKYGQYSGYNPTCAALQIDQNYQAQAQVTVPACAVPTNYRQTSFYCASTTGVLSFNYTWDSSSGKIGDLASCTIQEVVRYDNNGVPPSPPFPNFTFPNPTVIPPNSSTRNGSSALLVDRHSPPSGSFVKPYSESTFNGSQDYQWNCACNGTGWTIFPGFQGIPIVRQVTKPTGTWEYKITKSSQSCTLVIPQ